MFKSRLFFSEIIQQNYPVTRDFTSKVKSMKSTKINRKIYKNQIDKLEEKEMKKYTRYAITVIQKRLETWQEKKPVVKESYGGRRPES